MKSFLYIFSKYSPWHHMQRSILSNHFEYSIRHSSLDMLRRSSSYATTAASGDSNRRSRILSLVFKEKKKERKEKLTRSPVRTVGWMWQSLYSWFHQKCCFLCGQWVEEDSTQAFSSLHLVTTHSPTLPSLYLRHSSLSNPSVTSPTSQFILQPFFRFSYVTTSSLNSPGEPPMACAHICSMSLNVTVNAMFSCGAVI